MLASNIVINNITRDTYESYGSTRKTFEERATDRCQLGEDLCPIG